MKLNVVHSRRAWYTLSAISILLSIASLLMWGLKQGIDFTGGSLLSVRFSARPTSIEVERTITETRLDLGSIIIQPVGTEDIQFRMRTLTEAEHQQIFSALKSKYPSAQELRFDAIGPVVGEELRQKSVQGLVIVLLAIMAYVAYVFRKVSAPVASWKYGAITIFTAFHDIIVPLGVFSVLGHFKGIEVGTAFIAAILTIMGYSITDTIVVMDRIRENLQKRTGAFKDIVEVSVEQTYLRSLNTSIATLLTLIAIFLFGGPSLHDFTLTLIIGISVGTYSSIFVASPMLVSWDLWSKKRSIR